MRQGSLEHEGTRFNLHVLREDPALREILSQGVTHSGDSSNAKHALIQHLLDGSR